MRTPGSETRGTLRLEGRLVDGRAQPVAGARVWLDSEILVVSGEDGRFVFADRAPGMYRLAAYRDDLCADTMLVVLHEERGPVLVTMAPGITLRVQVTDGDSAIAGAKLIRTKEEVAISGSDGVAVVRGVGAQFQMFEVVAHGFAPTFLSMSLAPDPGGTIERSVRLVRGAPVSGVVLDSQDQPVAEASVRVWGTSWGCDATTDANGRWRLDTVAAGTYEIRASSKRHAAEPYSILELDGSASRADVVVRVARGGTITGTVTDRTGAPVPDVEVIAMNGESDHRREETTVRSDERGQFEINGLKPGGYEVFAHESLRASPITRVVLADGDVLAAELLVEEAAIAGVVVDTDGNPVSGAELRANAPVVRGDLSDERGRFFLGAFPPGEYQVQAHWPDQHERTGGADVRITAGDTRAHIVLPAAATIRGRVLFEGAPLPHFGVLVTTCPRFPWIGRAIGVRTEDGRFALAGVTPGTWGFVLAGPGTSMHTIDSVTVDEGGAIDLGDIELRRGQRITGRVLDTAGAPVGGATVTIGRRSLDEHYDSEPLQAWFQCEFRTVTDATGTFAFDGITSVRPPNARPTPISATHPDRGTSVCSAVPEGDAAIDLILVATGTIDGQIEGFPGGFASVAAHRKGEPADLRSARVTASGAFAIDRVPPGDYAVVMTGLPRKSVAPAVKVAVVANSRTTVRLVMPTGPANTNQSSD